DDDTVAVACDETTTVDTLRAVAAAFGVEPGNLDDAADALPADLRRRTPYLTHPVFSAHRSETAMMRYLRTLSDKDLALDRTMIPLGSCTMKLNAATEMAAITWPEFANLHPFVPAEQARRHPPPRAPAWPPPARAPRGRRGPGTRPPACSATPGPRASSPGSWPSAAITNRAGTSSATSA